MQIIYNDCKANTLEIKNKQTKKRMKTHICQL